VVAIADQRKAGRDPSHGSQVATQRGATQTRRWRELRDWKAENSEVEADLAVFEREILPAIQRVPLSELMQATRLSLPYVSQIRQGRKIPIHVTGRCCCECDVTR
jgi:hypothetical protein